MLRPARSSESAGRAPTQSCLARRLMPVSRALPLGFPGKCHGNGHSYRMVVL
jgi:hypothetical protein